MPEVNFVEADGTEHQVDVPNGTSIMQAAVERMIPGIEGDCGGLCACGTCHVYLEEPWATSAGTVDELEQGMLEFAFDVDQRSRLSCQITMTQSLAGMRVLLPKRQY